MTSLKTYSNKKIRIKPERRGHIQALLTKPEDHKTIEAIDGSRNVSQIVMGATGEADTFALSLLYVLLETGIAEAVEG